MFLFTKSVCKSLCFVFLSFLCDNLLLQKCVQSLCEMTVFLCVNLIDPAFNHVNVGIDLVDLNDNAPVAFDVPEFVVYEQGRKRLLGFNSSDWDRDVVAGGRAAQEVRIVAVRRYTWPFVGEMLASWGAEREGVGAWVRDVIRAQREMGVKATRHVDLETVFQVGLGWGHLWWNAMKPLI